MSDLEDFSKAIKASGDRREAERVEFNRKLGEPAHFVPSEDDPRFGIGFWKLDDGAGVVTYRRYANGYDPFSRTEYPTSLIAILNDIVR